MTPKNSLPCRLSERQTAEFLGVSARTLQDWRARRCGPAYSKLGNARQARIVYDLSDIETFLADSRVEPKAA